MLPILSKVYQVETGSRDDALFGEWPILENGVGVEGAARPSDAFHKFYFHRIAPRSPKHELLHKAKLISRLRCCQRAYKGVSTFP